MSDKKLKIVYLLGSLNRGGTETLLMDVFSQTETAPFKMACIYRKDGTMSSNFKLSMVPVLKITPGPVLMIWLFLLRLRRMIKELNADIIHANQSLDTLYARMACFGLPLKIVQTTHEFDYNYSTLGKSMKWLSFKSSDHNLFVSRTLCEYYILKYKLKKNDTTIIHNAVNFSKLGDPSKISIQSICNISKGVFKLGMVGNFVPGHDQATVCRFLSLLNEQNLNFNFLFIGAKDKNSPQFYDTCVDFCNKHGLNKKVVFTGSRSDVPELLPQFDSFIYSSNYDGFGIAVIEAIAAGITVIVNDLEVMREITDNGERAILFQTNNEHDLLKKFMRLYEDQENCRITAKENAEWAKRKYDILPYMERLNQVYKKVINSFQD